jgi:hypothetical protein
MINLVIQNPMVRSSSLYSFIFKGGVFLLSSCFLYSAEKTEKDLEVLLEEKNVDKYHPEKFKHVRLVVLQKSTQKSTVVTLSAEEPERTIDELKIICKGAYIEKITPQFNAYWSFVEIYKFDNKLNQENHIFSNWLNSIISSFHDPDWIIQLEQCE